MYFRAHRDRDRDIEQDGKRFIVRSTPPPASLFVRPALRRRPPCATPQPDPSN
jgi:hypothetical protein